ncbi:MAG: hypothetical protein ACOCUI_00220 [bacterium]
MKKYKVIKLIKIKQSGYKKPIFKRIEVYPYSLSLGHAKACARIVNSQINYHSKDNVIMNVLVLDSDKNIVFIARRNIDGIYGKTVES